MAKKSNDFWLGRLAVEVAVALTFLESGDVDLAREGLSETLEALMEDNPDPELLEYIEEVRKERHALTPVKIPYQGEHEITGQEIASRL